MNADADAKDVVIRLSNQKWRWMAERNVALFHEEAVFVHMGGSMTQRQELDTVTSGTILVDLLRMWAHALLRATLTRVSVLVNLRG